jgi:hypothetical protein
LPALGSTGPPRFTEGRAPSAALPARSARARPSAAPTALAVLEPLSARRPSRRGCSQRRPRAARCSATSGGCPRHRGSPSIPPRRRPLPAAPTAPPRPGRRPALEDEAPAACQRRARRESWLDSERVSVGLGAGRTSNEASSVATTSHWRRFTERCGIGVPHAASARGANKRFRVTS